MTTEDQELVTASLAERELALIPKAKSETWPAGFVIGPDNFENMMVGIQSVKPLYHEFFVDYEDFRISDARDVGFIVMNAENRREAKKKLRLFLAELLKNEFCVP